MSPFLGLPTRVALQVVKALARVGAPNPRGIAGGAHHTAPFGAELPRGGRALELHSSPGLCLTEDSKKNTAVRGLS